MTDNKYPNPPAKGRRPLADRDRRGARDLTHERLPGLEPQRTSLKRNRLYGHANGKTRASMIQARNAKHPIE
jgi:hypothetical protein